MAFFEPTSWSSSSPIEQFAADRFPLQSPVRPLIAIKCSDTPPQEGSGSENHIDTDTSSGWPTDLLLPSITPSNTVSLPAAQPVLVPTTPINRRDPDRVPTPLSGRGDRKGHLFPITDTSPTRLSHSSVRLNAIPQTLPASRIGHTFHHRSLSLTLPARSIPLATMHPERTNSRYTPTSPLSPRLGDGATPIPSQPSRVRGQASRPMNIPMPKYHPLHFQQQRDALSPTSSSQYPVLNYTAHSSSSESAKLMKERQRELIDKAKMSSRIAASPSGVKPDAPRLDPLRSPKGPVTPLALEGDDYFLMAGGGSDSPSGSPGPRREGSANKHGDAARVKRVSKGDGCGGGRR